MSETDRPDEVPAYESDSTVHSADVDSLGRIVPTVGISGGDPNAAA